MPTYHPQAEKEFKDILAGGGREVKRSLGMMIQRHLRMENGQEPLGASELLPSGGAGGSKLFGVTYECGLFGRVMAVYESSGQGVTLLAIDAWQGFSRVGLPRIAPDATARAWGRSS